MKKRANDKAITALENWDVPVSVVETEEFISIVVPTVVIKSEKEFLDLVISVTGREDVEIDIDAVIDDETCLLISFTGEEFDDDRSYRLKEDDKDVVYEYQYYISYFLTKAECFPSKLSKFLTDEEFKVLPKARSECWKKIPESKRPRTNFIEGDSND
jgi:hypothetical protein